MVDEAVAESGEAEAYSGIPLVLWPHSEPGDESAWGRRWRKDIDMLVAELVAASGEAEACSATPIVLWLHTLRAGMCAQRSLEVMRDLNLVCAKRLRQMPHEFREDLGSSRKCLGKTSSRG